MVITKSRSVARLGSGSPFLPAERLRPGNGLLVPVIRGQSAASLLGIGDALAERGASRGLVLSLVEIHSGWGGMATSAWARSRDLLRAIASSDYESRDRARNGRLAILSRFTSDPAASVREAALETQSDTVLVELPPPNAPRKHRLESILRSVLGDWQLNLVIARPDPAADRRGIRPASVLVPLRGGPNAWLALNVGLSLALWADARLTLVHVYDPDQHARLRRHEAEVFHDLARAAGEADPQIIELENDSVVDTLVDVATNHDTVVLGAHIGDAGPGQLVSRMHRSLINRFGKTVIVTRAAVERPAVA